MFAFAANVCNCQRNSKKFPRKVFMFFNMFFVEKCTDSSMFEFYFEFSCRRGTFRSPPVGAKGQPLGRRPRRQPWLKAVGAKGKCPFARNSYRHLSSFNSIYLLYLHEFNLRKLNTVRCMKRMKPMAKVHK